LANPNLIKFEEQTPDLRAHLRTGAPVHSNNPVRYGPAFLFVVQPLIVHTHSDAAFATWLYALQIVCVAGAFLLTWATLARTLPAFDWRLLTAWLAILWLNFAPVYTTIMVKSVENWELLLVSLALFAYVRERLWLMGFALAAAALVKVIPAIFFYY